jgi:hypothetical protein
MPSDIETLSSLLLAEHDGLVALVSLLKEEQQVILQRQTERLMPILTKIEDQLSCIRQCGQKRATLLKSLIPEGEKPSDTTLSGMIELLPANVREHSMSIAERSDVQMFLVHELAWQNQVLLSHSVHFLEQVLSPWLGLNSSGSIYGQNGSLQKPGKRQTVFQTVA